MELKDSITMIDTEKLEVKIYQNRIFLLISINNNNHSDLDRILYRILE